MTILGILIGWPVVFAAGLIVGWFVLPEPAFVRRIWQRLGFADRVN